MIESPQSFVVREECEKAAWHHGFRRKLITAEGWAAFGSTTVPGTIHLAASGAKGPWFLALDHAGVVEELDLPVSAVQGPGLARYGFETLGQLYSVLVRVYQLAGSLPDAPLREFQAKTKGLLKATEAERLDVQRIGQDIFRAGLIEYWRGRCPLTAYQTQRCCALRTSCRGRIARAILCGSMCTMAFCFRRSGMPHSTAAS